MSVIYLQPGASVSVGALDVVILGEPGCLDPAEVARLQARAILGWAAGLGVNLEALLDQVAEVREAVALLSENPV